MKKTVLITGCSSGIGYATVKYLRDNGFHVIASVRQASDVKKVTDLDVECLHIDLTDSASIDEAVDYIKLKHPTLYGLVNNGAYGQPGAVEDLSRDALRAQFETNLFGTHELTQKLMPIFRQRNEGRIVQISSVLGFVALPMRGAYNASKFALEGLTDTQRAELANTNIEFSLIEPGPIESRFRPNSYLYFMKYIDAQNSPHKELYKSLEARLNRKENARFTLPAEAVSKQILHALTSDKPKVRYRTTVPTIIMAVLKRLLSSRALDRFVIKHGN